MGVAGASADSPARPGESEAERLDRNYDELLQEMRVLQAGMQILFAFLLSLPFQSRFTQVTDSSAMRTSSRWCRPRWQPPASSAPSLSTVWCSGKA